MILSSCLHACFFNTVFSSRSRRYLISDQIHPGNLFRCPSCPFFAEHYKISATCPPTPLLATCQRAAVVEEEQHQTLLSGRSPAPDIGRQNVKMSTLRLPDALELPDTEGGHQLPGSQLRTEPQTLSLGSCRRPESSKNLFNIRYPRSNLSLDDLVCKIIIIYQNTHHSWQDPASRQRASKTLLRSPRL